MFDTTKLYIDVENPTNDTVIIKIRNPFINTTEITFGLCKRLKAKIMKYILYNSNHELRKKYWHNLIIDAILDDKSFIFTVLNNKLIEITLQMYCAIVYQDSHQIRSVPTTYHHHELLEDALYYSNFSTNLLYLYVQVFQPNRPKKYLEKIITDKINYVSSNDILFYIDDNQKTYEIEKKIVSLNPYNIVFAKLLNIDDIIDAIKKEKNIIFTFPVDKLNYQIILEALKSHGNYIFMDPRCCCKKIKKSFTDLKKINLNFLSLDELKKLKEELKLHYINEKQTKKYFKMFRFIDYVIQQK